MQPFQRSDNATSDLERLTMPDQDRIRGAVERLHLESLQWYTTLRRQFAEMAAKNPAWAMDRYGMELIETQEFVGLVGYCCTHVELLPAILEHSERILLRGDWQPRSACSMHNCLNQMKCLARCKLIKRLRAILAEE